MDLLRVENLVKGYGGFPVLRGVDLALAPGEALALLGPNGAGKSTLLRVLAGLHKPEGGAVYLAGELLRGEDPEQRRRIGFVSHDPLLYAGLSARENLGFTARLFGLPDASDRMEEVLVDVGLDWIGPRPVRAMSRGMVQRLTTARALLHQPELLLLDEPMSGLDPFGIGGLEEILVRFRSGGGAILMATHDLSHVVPVATRAAFLRQGRLVDGGPIDSGSGRGLEGRYRQLFPESRPLAPGSRT